MTDALKALPDTIRLVRRLASDADLPRAVRQTLSPLGLYLASPVNLIPDVIPILSYANDAIVAAVALRRVVRSPAPTQSSGTGQAPPADSSIVRRLAGPR